MAVPETRCINCQNREYNDYKSNPDMPIPYGAYILQVFIFTNFANLEAFAKLFQRKFSDCTLRKA